MKNEKPLGFWMCTALVVGNVIGMGIFTLPASLAPYGLNAFIGWAVTVLGCLFIAHVFANFARSLPNDDGPYGYTRRAFGNGTAFFIMWCYWISVWITNATLAVGIVGYLAAIFAPIQHNTWVQPLIALALIWFFVLVNWRGAKTSGRVQMLTTALKLLPMVAVIVLGLFLLLTDTAAYTAQIPQTEISFASVAAAGTIALYAMLGVECATVPAGKVHDPQHTLPRATLIGTAIIAVVYITISAIPMLLLPQDQLAQSTAPFVDLFNRYLGGDSGFVLALFVLVSGLGALNGWTLIAGEVTVSFAKHEVFPAFFAQPNRYGAPTRALLLSGVLASVMILMNYSRSLTQGFTFLSLMVTAANLPLYLIGGIALIKLFKRGVVTHDKPLLLLASAALASVYSAWAYYGMGAEAFWWSLVLGACSLPVFWLMRRSRKTITEPAVKATLNS